MTFPVRRLRAFALAACALAPLAARAQTTHELQFPQGIAVDGNGNVFVADQGFSVLKVILAAGGYTRVVSLGGGFNAPNGVAFDGRGRVLVADTYNNAIKAIALAGGRVSETTVAEGFALPTVIAVDGGGNLFVADTFNNAVAKIPASR